jgi:hypothetical protein
MSTIFEQPGIVPSTLDIADGTRLASGAAVERFQWE